MDSAGSAAAELEDRRAATGAPRRGSVLLLVENLSVPADRRVWSEAQALRRAGYRVSVICPRGKLLDTSAYEVLEGVAIHRFPQPFEGNGRWNYLLEYGWALLACFGLSLHVWRTRGFDVLHVGNPPDLFFPLAWFFKLFGKRFVFDQHDVCPETYLSKFEGGKPGLLHRLLLFCEKRSYRAADVVIVTNQSYRRIALERGRVPEDRVFIVRNSPNLDLFAGAKPDPSLKDGFRHLVAFVGIMAHQDGVDYLLRAAHHVVRGLGRDDVLFVLIGTGPAWGDLQRLHAELGLGDNVRFTGRIPDAPMLRILATADVCASPDPCNPLNDISTMTKLMEFMAMGKASVSFELAEARYSAQDAAVYIPNNDWRAFGDAIVALLEDPERRARMGESGRQRIRGELSWSRSESNLRAAYDRVLATSAPRTATAS
jgi:glycosyltransferase involved in cell wall biosynthesis